MEDLNGKKSRINNLADPHKWDHIDKQAMVALAKDKGVMVAALEYNIPAQTIRTWEKRLRRRRSAIKSAICTTCNKDCHTPAGLGSHNKSKHRTPPESPITKTEVSGKTIHVGVLKFEASRIPSFPAFDNSWPAYVQVEWPRVYGQLVKA